MKNNNSVEILKTNNDYAQYTGTVTIASYLGDRLIQKQTQHNAGLKTLFEFISSCLQGNWYEARDKRPCKLVMLQQGLDEDMSSSTPLTDPKDNDKVSYWSSKYAVCSPIMFDTAVVAESTNTSSSATYHFRVPFLSLVGGSTIKKLMLLPETATDYTKTACAYMVLNTETEIKVPVAAANYTIIIDWTLTFANTPANATTPANANN